MHTVLAPAKVNLVLEVGQRRADGFHELATVFQSISLYDQLTIIPADTDIELSVSGTQAAAGQLSSGQANLVWRAARLLASACGRAKAGVRIQLEKNIPIAAGLGGGSSDAAAALRGLAELWQVADEGLIARLAAQLGSDVTFFLHGGAALGRGRGEKLTPLSLPKVWLALANPGVPTSTAEVYRKLAELRAMQTRQPPGTLGEPCTRLIQALQAGNPAQAGQLLTNDLATPAVSVTPAIAPLLDTFRAAGALGVQVSGSGSTVFALASDADHAQELSNSVKAQAAWTWWGCSA